MKEDLVIYRTPDGEGLLLAQFVGSIRFDQTRTVNFLVALNARVAAEFAYTIRMEAGVQTPEETLASKSGSCRDSSWLLVPARRFPGCVARTSGRRGRRHQPTCRNRRKAELNPGFDFRSGSSAQNLPFQAHESCRHRLSRLQLRP